MAIQNMGQISNILKNNNTQKWVNKLDVDNVESKLKIKDASGLESINSKPPVSFGEVLAKSISDVNNLQKHANNAIERLATGKSKNIHETMLAVEKAELAFKQMNQVRLKVLDAYREIMKMQM